MKDYVRYCIEVGQRYLRADGSSGHVEVVDVEKYQDCGDVVVFDPIQNKEYRIDCFKLVGVRYYLEK